MSKNMEVAESVLKEMRAVFRRAVGTRRRRDYMRALNISNTDWIYALSADDVVDNKIPSRVAGDFARAKLFCKIAATVGLDCVVVVTANGDDLAQARQGDNVKIEGMPLIAINVDGTLRAFNPGVWPLSFIPGTICVGGLIRSVYHWMPCPICAIVPRDKFAEYDSYAKMHRLYLGGDVIP